jgi:hypothetical protein
MKSGWRMPTLPSPLMKPTPLESPALYVHDSAGSARGRRAIPRKPKKLRRRTIFLPDDLFEWIAVEALRRDQTISEYMQAILEGQVPDRRNVPVDSAGPPGLAGQC